MILVADSGSTNTDWIIINQNKIFGEFRTSGFNPYFTNGNEIKSELNLKFPSAIASQEVSKIFFYGSGCSSHDMKKIIYEGLNIFFKNATIEVNHDLLGTARAMFGNEKGIAVILGTGANTGLYNGEKIIQNIPSLGFILGDEGGGDYLGKLFITEYLYGNLPEPLANHFYKTFEFSNNQLLHKIYKEPYPNRFLASLSKFVLDNQAEPFLAELIKKSFQDLFDKHITRYKNYSSYKVRISGSIAFYFEEFIKEAGTEFDAKIDLIEKSPITRMALYHIKNE